MTDTPTPPHADIGAGGPDVAAQQARERIALIGKLFTDMSALLTRWLDQDQPADRATSQKMLAKLGELQTAHLMMLRAEEAFYDKFHKAADDDKVDYDAIRADIRRALDRIRATSGTGCICGRSDGDAT